MAGSLGPLASRAQRDRVRSWLAIGADEKADYRCFPAAGTMPDRGYFMQPGAFAAAASPMRIAQEEIFGPVLAVIPFETEAEAVAQIGRAACRERGGQYGENSGVAV